MPCSSIFLLSSKTLSLGSAWRYPACTSTCALPPFRSKNLIKGFLGTVGEQAMVLSVEWMRCASSLNFVGGLVGLCAAGLRLIFGLIFGVDERSTSSREVNGS